MNLLSQQLPVLQNNESQKLEVVFSLVSFHPLDLFVVHGRVQTSLPQSNDPIAAGGVARKDV